MRDRKAHVPRTVSKKREPGWIVFWLCITSAVMAGGLLRDLARWLF